MTKDEWKLFALSAISLYFELLVVRWTNAYVRNVGFFTNFLVLASFVGLGSGLLLAKKAKSFLPAFPLVLLAYCALVHVGRPRLAVSDPKALFWGEATIVPTEQHLDIGPETFVVIAFAMVAILFVLLGQPMGKLFANLPPLRGYAANVAGSLLGIVLFSAGSFVLATPVVWFSIVLGGVVFFSREQRAAALAGAAISVGCIVMVGMMNVGSTWSPYYRAEHMCLDRGPRAGDCAIAGNGIWGMQLLRFNPAPDFYTVIHGAGGAVKHRQFDDVLVIGAGGGNDVNVALHYGAKHVDAVEINPLVLTLGEQIHPDKPYSSPNVTRILDDGRAFLRRTDRKYDLVVYALPDSTGLVNGHANMRLESYLFTTEAFRAVRAHLKPDGVFALYNDYRQKWLVEKVAGMLREAFGESPAFFFFQITEGSAVLMAGPGVRDIELHKRPVLKAPPPPATDDWPYLYLKDHEIPALYLRALAIIGALSLAIVALFAWIARGENETSAHVFRIDAPMFFMGAAFMLLEAKSIVTFGLLFGTTWLTIALVIAAILVMVLAAAFIAQRSKSSRVWPWAFCLFAALAVVYAVPPETFVLNNPVLRYVVGAAAGLSPVMFANIIFAKLLRQSTETPRSLASNLLGSVVGGISEYLSLAFGFKNLLFVVAVFYTLALVFRWRASTAKPAESTHSAPQVDAAA